MKYVVLVCEGMADEPIAELDGRTPLEVAKTPAMSALAKKGQVGRASFVPHTLSARADVGCMSILGYDPKEFYTGIAPLEAISRGIPQNAETVSFRCDLVTVNEDILVDNSASYISAKESQRLIDELNSKLSTSKIKFYSGGGYKNLLVFNDAENAEGLDDSECLPPKSVIGQKCSKHLPKGPAAVLLQDLIEKSKVVLENHEINRVRIDLKENPANGIWPWGQGRKPKMPAFKQLYEKNGNFFAESQYAKGLSICADFKTRHDLKSTIRDNELAFIYREGNSEIYRTKDLKSKIKLIEDFDSQVVAVVKGLLEGTEHRILVTTDCAVSLHRKQEFHSHVPFLISGTGLAAEHAGFNEKVGALSKVSFDEGHKLMGYFLKGGVVSV